MIRKQFTFYNSFYQAIRLIKRKSDRCDAYEALIRYALYAEEPEDLPGDAAIALELARPVLDAARRKAKSGQLGGLASPRSQEDILP